MNDNSSIKIARLITIEKKIREAQSKTELEFLIVNELKDLVNYDVAILLSTNKIGVTEVKTISNISVDICKLSPRVVGPCKAKQLRWTFNVSSLIMRI